MDADRAERKARKDRAGSITAGMILITLGAVFLSGQLGLASLRDLWMWWPLVLIAIGIAHMVLGNDGEGWVSGLTNLFLGGVFLAINFRWFGFGWGDGWPLIFVAIGASMVMKAMFGRGRRRRDRDPDASGAVVVEEERHA